MAINLFIINSFTPKFPESTRAPYLPHFFPTVSLQSSLHVVLNLTAVKTFPRVKHLTLKRQGAIIFLYFLVEKELKMSAYNRWPNHFFTFDLL